MEPEELTIPQGTPYPALSSVLVANGSGSAPGQGWHPWGGGVPVAGDSGVAGRKPNARCAGGGRAALPTCLYLSPSTDPVTRGPCLLHNTPLCREHLLPRLGLAPGCSEGPFCAGMNGSLFPAGGRPPPAAGLGPCWATRPPPGGTPGAAGPPRCSGWGAPCLCLPPVGDGGAGTAPPAHGSRVLFPPSLLCLLGKLEGTPASEYPASGKKRKAKEIFAGFLPFPPRVLLGT